MVDNSVKKDAVEVPEILSVSVKLLLSSEYELSFESKWLIFLFHCSVFSTNHLSFEDFKKKILKAFLRHSAVM